MNLFSDYTLVIRTLKDSELANNCLPESLLIERQGDLTTWYSPFDYVNSQAKIVIVGITPGHQQAANALLKARDVLLANGTEEQARKEAKVFASFSGAMRNNLVNLLDAIGINNALNIDSTKALFEDKSALAHFTSALRYPVMVNGKNYSGTPSMIATPFLKNQLINGFGAECQALPNAIYVPLGPKVTEAMQYLVKEGLLKADNVIDGLPHPSGANAERISYFLQKKSKEALSVKTNADKLDTARILAINKVKALTI